MDKVREYHLGETTAPAGCESQRLTQLAGGRGLGANILLAHFHYCNKGIFPFSDECKSKDLRTVANLNEDEIQFVQATRNHSRRHSESSMLRFLPLFIVPFLFN